jgi:DNA-binding transcriptional LysR family regulator
MSKPMSRWLKLLIGLLVTLLVGWLTYGPLGRGAAYIDLLQQRADFVLRNTEGPPVQARMSRAPLSRTVFLCGRTNDLQRDGLRDLPGYDGRMLLIGGISRVVWDPAPPGPRADTPPCRPGGPGEAGGGIPLLVELLGLAVIAWLIGLGLGWQFRRRPPRRGYLG